jgi:hypothetical protein
MKEVKDFDVLKTLVGETWSARSFAARATVADQRRSYPRKESLDTMAIGESLGPWRISRSHESFEWRLTDQPSINDRGAWEMSRHAISGEKGNRIRVILIGESAAGSFGYWEESTIARQLAARLARADEDFDVIDLTCVNASMELCIDIMKHAVTLDPDYFVVYCANNEAKSLVDNFDNGALNAEVSSTVRWSFTNDANLDQFGPSMIAALAAHCVNQLARVKQIADHFDVSLLYILPESNTVDWVPQEKLPFSLSGRDVLQMQARGRQAASQDDRHPSQLSAWEAGRTLQVADPVKARDLYDAAREIGIGAFVNAIPQTVSTVAESLRRYCHKEQIEHVDMPALFRSEDHKKWPDRQYFIDYCHLSAVGISELASECAMRISRLHGLETSRAVLDVPLEIAPREQFLGAVVGAIHNYHYGQPAEIVTHWVRNALCAGWPHAREFLSLIRSFLLERARETFTPARLESRRAFAELPDRYKLFFLKFAYHGRFDRHLVEILDAALGESTLETLLATRKDDLLAFSGDMYSLFYMDCQKGIRPRLRGSNRTGWERPDLEFLIDSPQFEVDIPPTSWQFDAIELTLDLEDVQGGTLACELDTSPIGQHLLVDGRARYRFELGRHRTFGRGMLRSVRFKIDHMISLADKKSTEGRYRYLGRFGWYPSCGRIVGLRLCAAGTGTTEHGT